MTTNNTIPEHDGTQFTAEERLRYRHLSSYQAGHLIFDHSLSRMQAILSCTLFIAYPSIWIWLVVGFIIARAQHGRSLIAHEDHYLLVWPQDKRKNDLVDTCIFAAQTFYLRMRPCGFHPLPFRLYQASCAAL
ncbi:MAG: hypothetical protein P8J17_12805 [Halioglobus sp.]|nr:hypothetical protein [Halioglobus sp.]